eukprot:CAMPEP_0172474394 /NCGR_PEP_ID=MMETSP1065-20121228/69335_1 /TAXON_ID=265537 /ORGANISM="Amphiprora paludosa, Strain CCMP125" /LENGTH=1051 /DNA_ID=CAMNT_0013232575 /DNA_START=98 /DNA_END=3254 /DNA_ORIENTATION=+
MAAVAAAFGAMFGPKPQPIKNNDVSSLIQQYLDSKTKRNNHKNNQAAAEQFLGWIPVLEEWKRHVWDHSIPLFIRQALPQDARQVETWVTQLQQDCLQKYIPLSVQTRNWTLLQLEWQQGLQTFDVWWDAWKYNMTLYMGGNLPMDHPDNNQTLLFLLSNNASSTTSFNETTSSFRNNVTATAVANSSGYSYDNTTARRMMKNGTTESSPEFLRTTAGSTTMDDSTTTNTDDEKWHDGIFTGVPPDNSSSTTMDDSTTTNTSLPIDWMLIVVYSLVFCLFFGFVLRPICQALFRKRPKALPPLAPELLEHWWDQAMMGTAPSWILRQLFRHSNHTTIYETGVCELQTNWWWRHVLLGQGSGQERRLFVVRDPVLARRVLQDKTTTLWNGGIHALLYQELTYSAASNFVSTSSLPSSRRWKHVRASTAPAFLPEQLQWLTPIMEDVCRDWMATQPPLQQQRQSPPPTPRQPWKVLSELKPLILRMLCRVLCDYEFRDNDECQGVLTDWETAARALWTHSLADPWKCTSWTRGFYKDIQQARYASQRLMRFGTKVLLEYRLRQRQSSTLEEPRGHPHRRRASSSASSDQHHNRPCLLIELMERDREYQSDEERVADLILYVISGLDSTVNTVAFGLLELAQHTAVQKELRQALRTAQQDPSQETTQTVSSRHCLEFKHMIRETLRLHPAQAHGSTRILAQPVAVPGTRYVIPAGSVVNFPIWAIQRNEQVFGEYADVFDPSRWQHSNDLMKKAQLAFSAGRRNCMGQGLAHAMMETIFTMLLTQHEYTVAHKGSMACHLMHQPVDMTLFVKPLAPPPPSPPQEQESTNLTRGEADSTPASIDSNPDEYIEENTAISISRPKNNMGIDLQNGDVDNVAPSPQHNVSRSSSTTTENGQVPSSPALGISNDHVANSNVDSNPRTSPAVSTTASQPRISSATFEPRSPTPAQGESRSQPAPTTPLYINHETNPAFFVESPSRGLPASSPSRPIQPTPFVASSQHAVLSSPRQQQQQSLAAVAQESGVRTPKPRSQPSRPFDILDPLLNLLKSPEEKF